MVELECQHVFPTSDGHTHRPERYQGRRKVTTLLLLIMAMSGYLEAVDHSQQVQNQGRAALVAWAAIDNAVQPALVEFNVSPLDYNHHLPIPLAILQEIYQSLPMAVQEQVQSPSRRYSGFGEAASIISFSVSNWLSRVLHPRGLDQPTEVALLGEQRRRLLLYDPGTPVLGGEQAQWPDDSDEAWINPPRRLTLHDHCLRSVITTPGDQRWLILMRPPRRWLADRVASIGWLQPFQSEIAIAELVTVATPAPHQAQQATAILALGIPWLDRLEGYHQRLAGDNPVLEEWEQEHLNHLEEQYAQALDTVQPSIEASSPAEGIALLRARLQRGDPEALLADLKLLRQSTADDELTGEQLSTDIGRQALQILTEVEWDRSQLAQWSYTLPADWRIAKNSPRQPWPDPAYVEASGAFAPAEESEQP